MSDASVGTVDDDGVVAGLVTVGIGISSLPDEERIQQTEGLARALGVHLAFTSTLRVRKPTAAILLGAGQADALRRQVEEYKADILIIDCDLSPVQQRNLERRLTVKIIDRTGLILEIFGLRARTAEGRLQVEMARLLYERSRLVRTWTHLERQRGGRGFLSGPGESQLEADRRMLDRQISRLRSDLDDVRKTRGLQRTGRRRRGNPVVALVGYTNAGKSTLFNKLTGASVFAADMPFATLDPTVREVELPSGRVVSIIDTVGFITELPTNLIESFRATLEEAIEADLLLHVRDISCPDTERQREDVEDVLDQLQTETGKERPPILEVWNKVDRLPADEQVLLFGRAAARDDAVAISALNGENVSDLLSSIEERLFASRRHIRIRLPASAGRARAWLHDHADVLEEEYLEDGAIKVDMMIAGIDLGRLLSLAPDLEVLGE